MVTANENLSQCFKYVSVVLLSIYCIFFFFRIVHLFVVLHAPHHPVTSVTYILENQTLISMYQYNFQEFKFIHKIIQDQQHNTEQAKCNNEWRCSLLF